MRVLIKRRTPSSVREPIVYKSVEWKGKFESVLLAKCVICFGQPEYRINGILITSIERTPGRIRARNSV